MSRPRPAVRRLRGTLAMILLVVGCLAVATASIAVWLERSLIDTGGYVDTVAGLPAEEPVAADLSDYLVEQLATRTDAEAVIAESLSTRLGAESPGISRALAASLEVTARRAVTEALQSEQFHPLWRDANRSAHALGLAVVRGEDPPGTVRRDGVVELDLRPLLERAAVRVEETAGISVTVPADVGRVEVFTADDVTTAQRAVELLETASWVLPVLALVLLAAAVLAASDRLRMAMYVGGGVVAAATLTAIVLRFARVRVREEASGERLSAEAVDVIWRELTAGLRAQTWLLLLIGVLVLVGAAVLGGARWGTALRRALSRSAAGDGRAAALIRDHTGLAYGAALGAGALLLLLWPGADLGAGLVILALTAAALVAIAYVARPGDAR